MNLLLSSSKNKVFPLKPNYYTLSRIIIIFLIPVIIIFYEGCKNSVQPIEPSYSTPNKIVGQIKNAQNLPINNAKVTLSTAPNVEAVWSNSNGSFEIDSVPSAQHKIKVERYGFETFEENVPSAINGTSSMSIKLTTKTYNVPSVKPVSIGPVRINGNQLETDFDGNGIYEKYQVKGCAFSPMPIGNFGSIPNAIIDRSIKYLKEMNANTIRTYSGASKYLLQKAAENNIHVIYGFWVNTDLDLSDPNKRNNIIESFTKTVTDLKDNPAILIWNIGNEQNYVNGNNSYWYSLVQELAVRAYKIEGANYHPVCASNGNVYNIGNTSFRADDASLTYMDLWGSNAYQLNFSDFFNTYRNATKKPLVITEFGIDAYNYQSKAEYQIVQAYIDSTNWIQISAANDICVGATVFEFTDEWWKDSNGSPFTHDFGGYPTNQHPDGYSNEEWWGVISIAPDSNNDGLDEWTPRKVFYTFKNLWGN